MELALSIAAIVISLIAIFNERVSLHDQAYDKFSQLWFGMDQIFIDYPYMHKYFYKDEKGEYFPISTESKDFELAVCIAERFSDVFQYTDPLEKYLSKKDRDSYIKYKQMILNSPIVSMAKTKYSHSDHYLWNRPRN